jgi:hypothetical protein
MERRKLGLDQDEKAFSPSVQRRIHEPELDRVSFPRLQSWLQSSGLGNYPKRKNPRNLLIHNCPGREDVISNYPTVTNRVI